MNKLKKIGNYIIIVIFIILCILSLVGFCIAFIHGSVFLIVGLFSESNTEMEMLENINICCKAGMNFIICYILDRTQDNLQKGLDYCINLR